MEGLGTTSTWSLSRGIDFNDLSTAHAERDGKTLGCKQHVEPEQRPLRILILGASDPAHIIKTVARAWRKGRRRIEFVVLESQISALARTILLLDVMFSQSEVGTDDRASLFLELYGNLLVRSSTTSHVRTRCAHFMSTLSASPTSSLAPGITLSSNLLKFREKDDLDSAFDFFRSSKKRFDASAMWDARLRRLYGNRYDSREAVVDWDFNMKVRRLAPSIDAEAFAEFRASGVGFPVRSAVGTDANRTLATVDVMKDGDGCGVAKWGVFSDVAVGPFCAWGLDSEDKRLLREEDRKRVIGVRDVCLWNLKAARREWETSTVTPSYDEEVEQKGSGITQVSDVASAVVEGGPEVAIHIGTLAALDKLSRSFPEGFDRIFVASALAARVPELLPHLAKPEHDQVEGAVMVVEAAKFVFILSFRFLSSVLTSYLFLASKRFVLDFTKGQTAEYVKRVTQMAEEAGLATEDRWQVGSGVDPDHLLFKLDAARSGLATRSASRSGAGMVTAV
ncbi:Dynein assembly factor 3, axonemal [Thoreauomyces humboldtii]|nr:Dynein assembly factor 3, axonemal [Thoreauomyces humboldtii]